MSRSLLPILDQRRPEIRARWEALLRLEKPVTPLASPDILIHLFDHTLDDVLALRRRRSLRKAAAGAPVARCSCNPLRPYFATLEQALLEALIWAQAAEPTLTPGERVAQVSDLCERMRGVAHRELLLLESVCQCACAHKAPA
jgi:hypothetical protein